MPDLYCLMTDLLARCSRDVRSGIRLDAREHEAGVESADSRASGDD